VFIRSDQYSFVRQGVPAVFPVPGFKSSDPKIKPMEIFQNWEATRYHHPEDMNQPGLLFDEAAKYARYMLLCGYLVVNETQRQRGTKTIFWESVTGRSDCQAVWDGRCVRGPLGNFVFYFSLKLGEIVWPDPFSRSSWGLWCGCWSRPF
jgi:hypothetical protein